MNNLWAILGHTTEFLNYGVILADADHTIIQMNAEARRIFDVTTAPRTIEEFTERLPKRMQFIDHVNNCGKAGLTCDFHRVELSGGANAHVYLTPILDGTDIIGSLISIQNATSGVDRSKARDQFLSALVHELRTPLSAIKGSSSILEEDFSELIAQDANVKQLVELIHSGSENVLEMVNQFLDMSKLEDESITFELQAFTLGDVVRDTAASLEVLAQQRGLALNVADNSTWQQQVVGDPGRVRQVLTNLIANGLKFTQQGSVTVDAVLGDETVEVTVADTGAGIPDADHAGLFQKYFQTSNNQQAHDTAKSTGLGLYIVRLIMEGMGGAAYLKDSQLGAGSTFAFSLDVATPARTERLEQQVTDISQGVHHRPLEKKETVKIV